MKNRLLLIVLLLSTNISFAQKNTLTFPEVFLGIYKGKLAIHQANDEVKEIPMEFHLLETDTVERFIYKLVYDGQPRNYNLVEVDAEKGLYEVDENNGIILPSKLVGNTLYSYFRVGKNFLSSRLSFSKKQLEFEILFSNMEGKERTGENTDYEIYGYPITTVQRAILKKD